MSRRCSAITRKRGFVSDVTLVLTLSSNDGLSLAASRNGDPTVGRSHKVEVEAEVNGPQTTFRVAAGRLRHALEELDALDTTLRVPADDKPLVLTRADDRRVVLIPQAQ